MPTISFTELYSQGRLLFNPEEPEQSILIVRKKLGKYPEYLEFRIEEMLLGHDANKAHSVPKENGPWYYPKEGCILFIDGKKNETMVRTRSCNCLTIT